MEEDELKKPVMIFGRDVTKIPCFRDSLMWGAGTGIGSALLVFMFTSKPRLASHALVGSFTCATIVSWIVCREKWAYNKWSMGQIQGVIRGATSGEILVKPGKGTTDAVEVVDV